MAAVGTHRQRQRRQQRRVAGNANEDDGNEDLVVVFGLLERDDILLAKLKRLLSD